MFWSLEADPAHRRPEAALRAAGEGEPLLQLALRAVVGGAAAAAQGRRQLCGVHPDPRRRSPSARWPPGPCRGRGGPVPGALLAPRRRVVVVGDGDARLAAFRSLAAHGARRRRRPEQEPPQVTEQDAAAALQHAPAARHRAGPGQELTEPRTGAGGKQRAANVSRS